MLNFEIVAFIPFIILLGTSSRLSATGWLSAQEFLGSKEISNISRFTKAIRSSLLACLAANLWPGLAVLLGLGDWTPEGISYELSLLILATQFFTGFSLAVIFPFLCYLQSLTSDDSESNFIAGTETGTFATGVAIFIASIVNFAYLHSRLADFVPHHLDMVAVGLILSAIVVTTLFAPQVALRIAGTSEAATGK